MSLRSKIALVLFVAVALFVGVDLYLQDLNFSTRFRELDAARAEARMQHLLETFDEQATQLETDATAIALRLGRPADWAASPPSEALLSMAAPAGGHLHMLVAYDAAGNVAVHRLLDPRTGEKLQMRELPNERLAPAHPLLRGREEGRRPTGLWVTGSGTLLLATTDIAGESADPREIMTLAVGRFLDEALVGELRSHSGVEFDVIGVQGTQLTQEQQHVLELEALEPGPRTEDLGSDGLLTWAVVSDLGGMPALILRAETPRELAPLWTSLRGHLLSSALAVAVLFPFVILLLLQWIVTGPLGRLTSHIVSIGHADDTDLRLASDRPDEIGQLAREFDSMLEKLDRSRRELVDTARKAGMSEVSSGVIHNVGNVLNSVNVSASMTRKHIEDLALADLQVILLELEGHQGELDAYLENDPRGKHLLEFFGALIQMIEGGVTTASNEVRGLVDGLDQIASLITSLQSTESRIGVVEKLDLASQVDAAVDVSLRSLDIDGVTVERDYTRLPRLMIDRHKVMEVLVHLIRNALQSIEEANPPDKRLALRIAREGEGSVCIEVGDNGLGISRDDLTRIFALGHSTKGEGSGMGLHLAGTTAGEMGGSLAADSQGLGTGATFRLTIPLEVAPQGLSPRQPSSAEAVA